MAKRCLDEKEAGVVYIDKTAYIPLPKGWREMLERNNLGVPYESQTHALKLRLMQNKDGQMFLENWFVVKVDAKPLKLEDGNSERKRT